MNDEIEDASQMLQEHLARNRKDLDVRQQTLASLLRGGRLQTAAGEIFAVMTDGVHTTQYHYDLIARLASDKQLAGRLRTAMESAANDKHAALAWYAAGLLCQALEQSQEAIKMYDLAIAADSKFAESYYNLANIYQGLGQTDRAIEYLEKSIRLKPALAEPHFVLGILFAKRSRQHEALDHLRKFVDLANPYLIPYVHNAKQMEKILPMMGELNW